MLWQRMSFFVLFIHVFNTSLTSQSGFISFACLPKESNPSSNSSSDGAENFKIIFVLPFLMIS
jgi:hypothetical protein